MSAPASARDARVAPPLAAARALAARGWRIFPLLPGRKQPAIRDWEARATTDPELLHRAWAAAPSPAGPYGIGIACGPSGLLVVDLDRPKGSPPAEWRLPGVVDGMDVLAVLVERAGQHFPWDTHTVATTSGGTHLYFTQPADRPPLRNTSGRLGWLVDTRGAGGYVVAAGSVVEGRAYTTVDDTDPAPLPGWLAGLLDPSQAPARDRQGGSHEALVAEVRRRSAYAASALRAEIDRVLAAEPGSRNQTLNAAGYALGRLVAAGLLPADLTAAALTQAAHAAGLHERETAATIRSGLAAGARHPRSPRP